MPEAPIIVVIMQQLLDKKQLLMHPNGAIGKVVVGKKGVTFIHEIRDGMAPFSFYRSFNLMEHWALQRLPGPVVGWDIVPTDRARDW